MSETQHGLDSDNAVYRTLLESTLAIPWKIDWATMQFAYIGPQIESLLGWSQNSWLTAEDWATRMHPEDRDYVVNFCIAQSKAGVDHEADYRALTKNNSYVWIRDVVHVVRNENGEIDSLIGFMFDISERKKTEEKLISLQKELGALTQADLALAKQRALQLHQQRLEQSQFLAMLTHELKTPLSLIQLVLGSQVPGPELIAYAKRAAQDMNDVIERCLQSEQLSDGQLATQSTAVNLREEYYQLQQSCAHPARLHLTMQSEVIINTDAKLLRIVLANLIDNALKYSPPDSAVDIIIAADASQAVAGTIFTIQNLPGTAGWPDASKVFQKYYRSRRSHHQTGSGLGLYLGHSMAQMLCGELRYMPDEIFIRFTLWLPL
jgi:PAS domain S-box-containing protein